MASEDGDAAEEKHQNEGEEQRDADRRSSRAVDGVGIASGEQPGDERTAIGGEELDDQDEDQREEEEAEWGEELGDEACDGLTLIADE